MLGFPVDASNGLSTYAEVRRVAAVEAKRASTTSFGSPKSELELSVSLHEMESPVFEVELTGGQRDAFHAAPQALRAPAPHPNSLLKSAAERVALLARKFAQGSLTFEEQSRVEVATQRVEAAFKRANPAAFEKLARQAEAAADGLAQAKVTLAELDAMDL